jgi:hypothetical protein
MKTRHFGVLLESVYAGDRRSQPENKGKEVHCKKSLIFYF